MLRKTAMLIEISTIETPKKICRKANIQAGEVAAPMSGRVIRVLAQEDNIVNAGDVLLSVTAMKMVSLLHLPYTLFSPFRLI
jgi:biotin carboxyl carrier protein